MIMLFAVHVATACIHTWVAFRFFPGHGDIWAFFEQSTMMKTQLLQHPRQFAHQMLSDFGAFNFIDKTWPTLELQYQVLLYLNVVLDFASFNHLYINTILFSFPVFAGTVALFKVFYRMVDNPLPAFCIMLLPSMLFWTSALYKEGIFITGIGYVFYYLLHPQKSVLQKSIVSAGCIVLIILSRANALITLLPALLFFVMAEKKSFGRKWAIVITIATVATTFILFNAISPENILRGISKRQIDFQALAGGSRIYLPALAPNVGSFVAIFPVALFNGFFQPLPGAGGKIIYSLFSAELLFIWAIILFACWLMIKKKTIRFGNFDIACLIFVLPGMIIIGYIVPFAGAIIRYRSIYLPFLLAPFLNIIGNSALKYVQLINSWLLRNVISSRVRDW